jgi:hypothetical protein
MAASIAPHDGTVSYGSTLSFEDLAACAPQPRMRAADRTLLRVVAGCVALRVGDEIRLLDTGGEAIIDAGVTHTVESVGGPARILTGLRPAAAR